VTGILIKELKLKEAHNKYYERLFDNSFSGNKRQFWKNIKAKRKDTNEISTIMIDRSPHTDTLSIRQKHSTNSLSQFLLVKISKTFQQ